MLLYAVSTITGIYQNNGSQIMEDTQMRINTLLKFTLFPLLLCISLFAHADNRYSSVYIFGDSLSDTGNLGSVIGGIPAPYVNNRISNGPVAVEPFAVKLGDTADASLHLVALNAGHNYSVAGARASGNDFADLDNQILGFQINHSFIAPADALYVIFLGGNDIRAALKQTDQIISESILQTANNKISTAIQTLKQMGARSFLVINAPNISLLPETRIIAAAIGNPEYIRRAEQLSKRFNKKLHHIVEKLEDIDGINIIEFDLYKVFSRVVNKASKFGFSNNTDACFSTLAEAFHVDCNYGFNADQFIFFDEIHPTTRVHAMFGEAFFKALSDDEHEDEHEENDD